MRRPSPRTSATPATCSSPGPGRGADQWRAAIRIPGLIDLTLCERSGGAPRALAATRPSTGASRRAGRWSTACRRPHPALVPRRTASRPATRWRRAAMPSGRSAAEVLSGQPRPRRRPAALDRAAAPAARAPSSSGRLPAEEAGVTRPGDRRPALQPRLHRRPEELGSGAELIDRSATGSLAAAILSGWITGRLRRARALLVERAGKTGTPCTAPPIGLHGIMQALGPDAGPARSPAERLDRRRHGAEPLPAPAAPGAAHGRGHGDDGRHRATVAAGRDRAARARAGGTARARPGHHLHARTLELCPAEAFVPALLKAVWRGAA